MYAKILGGLRCFKSGMTSQKADPEFVEIVVLVAEDGKVNQTVSTGYY
jgi:hypothetical protein